jgi:hypothetical protein
MKDWMRSKMGKPWVGNSPIRPIGLPKKKKRKNRRAKLQNYNEARCREYLRKFWIDFNRTEDGDERLQLLSMAANPPWARVTKELRLKLRRQFQIRYKTLLDAIGEECGVCPNEWREKHHIVPLAYGGINEDINLLAICLECHDAIHPWMRTP